MAILWYTVGVGSEMQVAQSSRPSLQCETQFIGKIGGITSYRHSVGGVPHAERSLKMYPAIGVQGQKPSALLRQPRAISLATSEIVSAGQMSLRSAILKKLAEMGHMKHALSACSGAGHLCELQQWITSIPSANDNSTA